MHIYTSNTHKEGRTVPKMRGTLTPLSRQVFAWYYLRWQRYAEVSVNYFLSLDIKKLLTNIT
ncbi:MAG: hypothetical protein OFPII_37410 [Osedax symbiont Rs1]|nr:MAG: hypothetical protein OFPII_37410 [Osedax symbiont Rs1]